MPSTVNGVGFEKQTQFVRLGKFEPIKIKAIVEIVNPLSFDEFVGLANSKIAIHAV